MNRCIWTISTDLFHQFHQMLLYDMFAWLCVREHSFISRSNNTVEHKIILNPNQAKMWYAKFCFCFSHWVFNVYCILKCFFVIAYCETLFIFVLSLFCSPAHKHSHASKLLKTQMVMMMLITMRLSAPRMCVCCVCMSQWFQPCWAVTVAVAVAELQATPNSNL